MWKSGCTIRTALPFCYSRRDEKLSGAAPFVAVSVLQVDIAAWDSDDEGNVGMKREWKPGAKAIARKGFHFKRALFVSFTINLEPCQRLNRRLLGIAFDVSYALGTASR